MTAVPFAATGELASTLFVVSTICAVPPGGPFVTVTFSLAVA
jgi:hypothetical protein